MVEANNIIKIAEVLKPLLAAGRVGIIDGAFGTEVENRGVDLTSDSLWSAKLLAENPDLIVDVHKDYLTAGADIIITSSYQATVSDFMKKGYSEKESTKLIARSVQLGKRAVAMVDFGGLIDGRPRPLVAASVSPYGAQIGAEYTGDYKGIDDEGLKEFHR